MVGGRVWGVDDCEVWVPGDRWLGALVLVSRRVGSKLGEHMASLRIGVGSHCLVCCVFPLCRPCFAQVCLGVFASLFFVAHEITEGPLCLIPPESPWILIYINKLSLCLCQFGLIWPFSVWLCWNPPTVWICQWNFHYFTFYSPLPPPHNIWACFTRSMTHLKFLSLDLASCHYLSPLQRMISFLKSALKFIN